MIEILYRDSLVVVAKKPRGVLSEGSAPGGMPALVGATLGRVPLTVHRLDRETAGIMVFAFDKAAAARLSASLQEGKFRKEYAAVVHGVPSPREGCLRDLLFRDAARGKSYLVDRPRRGVREAVLTYRTEAVFSGDAGDLSLVRVRLGTGRTHQIRVQFAGHGMPLYGDGRYGGRERGPLGLYAASLAFPHPADGRHMSFSLPLPYEEEGFSFFAPLA